MSSTPSNNSAQHSVIIGAGPGGYVAAIRLAQLTAGTDHKITVIDKAPSFGGVCLNWGCIPSKALIHAASVYKSIGDEAALMGISTSKPTVDLPKMMRWKDGIVKQLTGGIAQLFKTHGIHTLQGEATFKDANTLSIKKPDGSIELLAFDQCLIATGSSSIAIPSAPLDGDVVITSNEAVNLQAIPQHLVVVGGGVIGLELGVFYHKLGSQVTVVEMQPNILPGMDADIVKAMTRSLKKRGLTILTNTALQGVSVAKGQATVTIKTETGTETITADKVLVAVGRKPNTSGLNLSAAGITVDAKGFIPTDDQLRTGKRNIFAIGDTTKPPLLAHKASKEGLVAAAVMAGGNDRLDIRAMPSAVFTDPEIASVGLTEAEAVAKGLPIKVGTFPFAASGRALTMNAPEGMAKIIAHGDTDEILGVHLMGAHVADLIGEAALGIELGATAEDLALTVHTHPTLAEVLMEAAEAVHDLAIHVAKPPSKKPAAKTSALV